MACSQLEALPLDDAISGKSGEDGEEPPTSSRLVQGLGGLQVEFTYCVSCSGDGGGYGGKYNIFIFYLMTHRVPVLPKRFVGCIDGKCLELF